MDTSLWLLIALGVVAGTSLFNAALFYRINKKVVNENSRLVKAIIAKELGEYAAVESSPEEDIEKMETENDLAMNAARLAEKEDHERGIPII